MYFWILVLFCRIWQTDGAPQTYYAPYEWKLPSGHCDPICSCQMDGLYYSDGETWNRKNDPCTVYQCNKDGTFNKTKKGCLYKNECKEINTTWSESCNTFTCVEGKAISFYKLVEAGCEVNRGKCIRLGDQIEDGCKLIECQLNDTCLSLNTIQKGCSVEDACMDIGSYWHDGCTIFSCAHENTSLVKKPILDEVMQWPDGNYAMLKPDSGCPNDVPALWTEGSRLHYNTGRNYFSNPLQLSGNYAVEFMRHEFCVHGTSRRPTSSLKYKTYWEQGSYCIMRRNGNCPRGFSDGYLMFDDKDNVVSTKPTVSGNLPDGDYGTDTGIYFCCRNDGKVFTPIVLPKEDNFVLFMNKGEAVCQAVRGMKHSVKFFTFNGDTSARHEQRGQVPSIRIANNDLTIYFCHYTHKECGCTDISGEFIAGHTEKEINCTIKRCVSEKGKTTLEVVSGGCPSNGTCRKEGTTWAEFLGDSCIKKTCTRVVTDGVISFEVKESLPGCKDGEICKDVGTEIYRECYTSQCMVDTEANTTTFKVIKADCPWLDTCKAPNATWEDNCIMYQCDMSVESGQYKWNVQSLGHGCSDGKGNCYEVGQNVSGQCFDAICTLSENKTIVYLDVQKRGCARGDKCTAVNSTWTEGCHEYKCEWIDSENGFTALVNATSVSCEWKGKCYKQDDVWSDGCVDYKCIVTRQNGRVKWSVKTARLACMNFNGSCAAIGEEITRHCVTYKCAMMPGNRIGLNVISTGCDWNRTCQPENSTWNDTDKCIEYQCQKNDRGGGVVMQVAIVGYGCVFNNTCMPVNSTWPDGCKTRKCEVQRVNRIIQRSIAPISAGCDDEGMCRNVGYIKITDACMEYRCIFNETFKDAFFSLVSGECRATDGTCKAVGSQWTENKGTSCVVYECQQNKLGYISKTIEQKCIDASGNCVSQGTGGFRAYIDGTLHDNCSCEQSTIRNQLVSVVC